MKNYAEILLHEELSASQKDIVQVATRAAWLDRFWEYFVIPAVNGVAT
jgi:hypothetical protein